MANVILERTFDPPLTEERHAAFAERLSPCLERNGIEWIRSHLSLDRHRLICVFQAPDAGAVRSALRQARVEHERVWSCHLLEP